MRHVKVILFSVGLLWACCTGNFISSPETNAINVYYKYSFLNVLDTFHHSYQKDLVMNGTVSTLFDFTENEENKIIQKVEEVGFFELPDTILADPDCAIDPDPGWQILRIEYQGNDHTISWRYPLPDDDIHADRLLELVVFIGKLIESTETYQNLPPANGGYV